MVVESQPAARVFSPPPPPLSWLKLSSVIVRDGGGEIGGKDDELIQQ